MSHDGRGVILSHVYGTTGMFVRERYDDCAFDTLLLAGSTVARLLAA
jgi:hypothetical protein